LPTLPVKPDRLPKIQVRLSEVVSVCAAVSKLAPPFKLSCKLLKLNPVTGSVNVIVIEPTLVVRGLGVTGVMDTPKKAWPMLKVTGLLEAAVKSLLPGKLATTVYVPSALGAVELGTPVAVVPT